MRFHDSIRPALLLAAALLFLAPSAALALTQTYVLSDLHGQYERGLRGEPLPESPESRRMTVDLGTRWSRIDSISVSVLGDGRHARVGYASDPKDAHELLPPSLLIQLGRGDSEPIRLVFADLAFTDHPTWQTTVLDDSRGEPPYGFALEGRLDLSVFLGGFFVAGTDYRQIFEDSSLFVKQFELTVTGQPIPEPGTGLLLLGGLALLASRNRA